MKYLLCLATLVVLAGCSQTAPAPAAVEVADASCKPALAGRDTTACYVSLTASRDDRLISVSSPTVANVQIHEMTTTNGMMKMGEMTNGLPLPAGETVRLASGGNHMMLFGAKTPLAEGGTVTMTLTFANAPARDAVFRIVSPVATEHAEH